MINECGGGLHLAHPLGNNSYHRRVKAAWILGTVSKPTRKAPEEGTEPSAIAALLDIGGEALRIHRRP